MTASLLVIVTARAGSKRLPGKNLMPLGDKTLLGWTAEAVRRSGLEPTVLLSTDGPEIAEAGRALGWSVPFLRPAELAQDDTGSLPVVLHALDHFSEAQGGDPDMVMLLQPTSPFRTPEMLAQAVAKLQDTPAADGVLGVTPVKVSGHWVMHQTPTGLLERAMPDAGTVYIPSGALYLIRTLALRRERALVPAAVLPLIHSGISALDIDTPTDFLFAQSALANWPAKETEGCPL